MKITTNRNLIMGDISFSNCTVEARNIAHRQILMGFYFRPLDMFYFRLQLYLLDRLADIPALPGINNISLVIACPNPVPSCLIPFRHAPIPLKLIPVDVNLKFVVGELQEQIYRRENRNKIVILSIQKIISPKILNIFNSGFH